MVLYVKIFSFLQLTLPLVPAVLDISTPLHQYLFVLSLAQGFYLSRGS